MLQNKLKDSFAFYRAYHRHPVNQIIHMITIPIIVFTILIWLSYVKFYQFDQLSPDILCKMLTINLGLAISIIYITFYLILDIVGGILMTFVILIMYLGANLFRYYVPYAWAWALGAHVIAWVFQFLGHGLWERRKPALFDSLIQAFLMAPYFVLMEIIFLCGFKKQLKEEIEERSVMYIPIVGLP